MGAQAAVGAAGDVSRRGELLTTYRLPHSPPIMMVPSHVTFRELGFSINRVKINRRKSGFKKMPFLFV